MNDYVRVGNTRDIILETEKAVCVPIGKTFSGDLITTWYPKQSLLKKPATLGWDLYAPAWTNRNRRCCFGYDQSIPCNMQPYDGQYGLPY